MAHRSPALLSELFFFLQHGNHWSSDVSGLVKSPCSDLSHLCHSPPPASLMQSVLAIRWGPVLVACAEWACPVMGGGSFLKQTCVTLYRTFFLGDPSLHSCLFFITSFYFIINSIRELPYRNFIDAYRVLWTSSPPPLYFLSRSSFLLLLFKQYLMGFIVLSSYIYM
jgi:hypothetical protein